MYILQLTPFLDHDHLFQTSILLSMVENDHTHINGIFEMGHQHTEKMLNMYLKKMETMK
jgi:hypothetical protein